MSIILRAFLTVCLYINFKLVSTVLRLVDYKDVNNKRQVLRFVQFRKFGWVAERRRRKGRPGPIEQYTFSWQTDHNVPAKQGEM